VPRGAGMTEDRLGAVWGLVATQAAAAGRRVSVADVCAVAVRSAGVSGAWVTASSDRKPGFVICVTDPVGEQLAELQLTLGEGPCCDVLASAAPVLAANLGDEWYTRRWPWFAAQACRLGAGAVFAFPLTIGAIRVGVMGMYRGFPGPLPEERLGDGLMLADVATVLLLDGLGHGDGGTAAAPVLDGQSPDLALHRAEIDQATGMLTVQLGVPVAEAFARLRAYAYAQDRRLADVARDIVARHLRLRADPGRDGGP
jgi:ANTAR domain-containing protein/GAF domain-containing protein